MAPPHDGIVSDGFHEFFFTIFVIILTVFLCKMGLNYRCGLAMLHKLAGGNPVQVIASHEPGIEPCRHIGNDVLDA
jgi:hypothetical protein